MTGTSNTLRFHRQAPEGRRQNLRRLIRVQIVYQRLQPLDHGGSFVRELPQQSFRERSKLPHLFLIGQDAIRLFLGLRGRDCEEGCGGDGYQLFY